jgi:hypothetical protein
MWCLVAGVVLCQATVLIGAAKTTLTGSGQLPYQAPSPSSIRFLHSSERHGLNSTAWSFSRFDLFCRRLYLLGPTTPAFHAAGALERDELFDHSFIGTQMIPDIIDDWLPSEYGSAQVLQIDCYGWPLSSAYKVHETTATAPGTVLQESRFIRLRGTNCAGPFCVPNGVPLRFWAPGVSINVLFWSLLVWLCATISLHARVRLRVRLGSCPACGYSKRGSPGAHCPECGVDLSHETNPI